MQHKLGNKNVKITNELLKCTLQKGHYGIENNEDFPILAFECFVCKSIHLKTYRKHRKQSVYNCEEPTSKDKTKENWWKNHWHHGRCQAKTLWYLLETVKVNAVTKEMFEEKYNDFDSNNKCYLV